MKYLLLLLSITFTAKAHFLTPSYIIPELIATGFQNPEGPVWNDSGLFFSDINANTIFFWSPVDNSVKKYLEPSGNSNGLAFDNNGRVILAQIGLRQISMQDLKGNIIPLVVSYKNKNLNSLNDITIKSNGTIFFSDPIFFLSPENEELGFRGNYSLTSGGKLSRTLLLQTSDRKSASTFKKNDND